MQKVLIVEDEDIMRKGLMFMPHWQEVDCIVVGEAANGQDGLEKIKKYRPDIVIVDINMPVMDGLEMLEKALRNTDMTPSSYRATRNLNMQERASVWELQNTC
jgi:two component transcriptional regulator, AraC family